jgi:hypothetical protein
MNSISERARGLADKAESILHNMPNGEGFDETHCRIARGQYDIAILMAELADAVQAHLGEGQSTVPPHDKPYPPTGWMSAQNAKAVVLRLGFEKYFAVLELAQAACVAYARTQGIGSQDFAKALVAWEAAMEEAGL